MHDKGYRRQKQVDVTSHKEKLRSSNTSWTLRSFLSTNDAPRNFSYVIPSTPAPSLGACSVHNDDNRNYSQSVPPFTCCMFHELSAPTVPVRFLVLCSASSKRCSSHIVIPCGGFHSMEEMIRYFEAVGALSKLDMSSKTSQ